MHAVVDAQRGRRNLDEALGIVGSPAVLHLAILAKLALCVVVGRVDTNGLERVGTELQDGGAVDVAL